MKMKIKEMILLIKNSKIVRKENDDKIFERDKNDNKEKLLTEKPF